MGRRVGERFGERFALARGLSWIPLTVAVFLAGWENVVAVTLLYSAYANVESGISAYFAARAGRFAQE